MRQQDSRKLTGARNASTALWRMGDILVSDMVFCLGYAVYLAHYVLFSTTPLTTHSSLITLLVAALMMLKIVITSMQRRIFDVSGLLVMLIAVVLVTLTQLNSGTRQLTILAALLLGAQDVRPKTIARVTFWTLCISVAVVLVLMAAGHLPDTLFLQGFRIRHSLGFTYVGMLDLYLLHLALLAMYLRGKSLHLYNAAIFLALHFWAYSWSIVRGTLMVSILAWALFLLFVKTDQSKRRHAVLTVASAASIPLCCFLSFFTAVQYKAGDPIWSAINQLFSGRLRLAQLALETYGVTPLGQAVTWVGNAAVQSGRYAASDYNYVDSGYIQVVIQFGVIVLVIACITYMVIALELSMAGLDSPVFQLWVIAVAIECLIYPNLLIIAYNSLYVIAAAQLRHPSLKWPAK